MKKIISAVISLVMVTEIAFGYVSTIRVGGFGGWVTSEEGNAVRITPKVEIEGWNVKSQNVTVTDNQFTMPGADVEIEGIVGEAQTTYTITYDANEGSGAPANQTKTEGLELTLSSTTPTRDGYKFLGWGTSSNSIEVAYQPGDNYTTDADINLYAIWKEKASWNEPVLGSELKPVNWNGSGWEETSEAAWEYNYEIASTWSNSVGSSTYGIDGDGTARWANAQTEDGSLYVWIPRFTYCAKAGDNVSWNADTPGTARTYILWSNGTEDYTSDSSGATAYTYKKHSAFSPGGVEITGFWVGKYEASEGTSSIPESKPGASTWNRENANDMYTYAKDLNGTNTSIGAHMLKDSEWGAVAYLTSAVGRIPYRNTKAGYTGYAGETQEAAPDTTSYSWNTEKGVRGSTTHNIYGIYDMSGGNGEITSAYWTGAENSNHTNIKGGYSKYADKYTSDFPTGDNARLEWDSDICSLYAYGDGYVYTMPDRGGSYYDTGSRAGIFSGTATEGDVNAYTTFRVAIFGEGHSITYDANGGQDAPNRQTLSLVESQAVITNEFPRKAGFNFLGWSTDSGAAIPTYSSGSTITLTEDITLYAIWQAFTVNEPVLAEGMIPVKWDDTVNNWVTTTEAEWDYNYDMASSWNNSVGSDSYGVGGNGTARWANIMLADGLKYYNEGTSGDTTTVSAGDTVPSGKAIATQGSSYVWIPRFTYCAEAGDEVSWNADTPGTARTYILWSNETEDYTSDPSGATTYTYKSHSAFTLKDKSGNKTEITGFWVGKYEASEGTNNVPKTKPEVSSWIDINVSDMYTYGKDLNGTNTAIGAHMLKDSEWGAVAYLTSAKGRIPYENIETGYTGYAESAGTSYLWNTEKGVRGSTTHNVYGVYDMDGGVSEFTSAYYSSGTTSYYNNLKTSKSTYGTKYVDYYTEQYPAGGAGAIYAWDGVGGSGSIIFVASRPTVTRESLFYAQSSSGQANTIGFRVALFGASL